MTKESEHPAWRWGDTEHYRDADKLLRDGRVSDLPELSSELKRKHHLIRRNIVFGQRHFEPIVKALNEGKEFVVVTGLLLRSTMHFGTKCVIDQLKIYQELGADIFIAFSDTENWFEGYSIKYSIDRAMEKFLVDCLALGLEPNPKKLQIYSQWSRKEILPLALGLSRFAPLPGAGSLGMAFFPMIVAADILHPQLEKYGGPRPTLVPVGLDQLKYVDPAYKVMDDYIRAISTRRREPLIAPTIVCHRMLIGTDREKMTATPTAQRQFAIRLHDEPDVIRKKLLESKTGEHKGGRTPYRCPLYELQRFHDPDDDYVIGVYENCVGSDTLCETCKGEIAHRVAKRVKGFQESVKEMKKDRDVIKFVLEQDILRETEAVVDITKGVSEGKGE